MSDGMLRADCAHCTGLCCVSLAFDRSKLFGFDKPAGVACHHLTADNACGIHAELEHRGFAGCARYDCGGAGQRVTELFQGRSWREHPALARSMFDAFRALREVHELLQLLELTGRFPLTAVQLSQRATLQRALQATTWSAAALSAFEHSSLARDVQAFMTSLRQLAQREHPRRRLTVIR